MFSNPKQQSLLYPNNKVAFRKTHLSAWIATWSVYSSLNTNYVEMLTLTLILIHICIWTLYAENAHGTTFKRLLFTNTIATICSKKWLIYDHATCECLLIIILTSTWERENALYCPWYLNSFNFLNYLYTFCIQATTSCKSTWDTVPYFGLNGLSMILCSWHPLHPFSKLLAFQDYAQNLEEQLWMGRRRGVTILSHRPVTSIDLKQDRLFFREIVSTFLQLVVWVLHTSIAVVPYY